ncbi:translation initiation factor IF-6 [Methanolobus halotolerans]|uniref:Translation initiation factor 6 n=1 Tax=Methanolobus halotolerans TaxID=2052935 RepID=A0A4E0QYF3_9EURY|nr:translation initiation factor IF-6 [Methanolobus halotolerans]TGC08699.1 translation initiation factor IF-6 [Methanolobus halotolerans]
MIHKLSINESPIIGAFATCTEEIALVSLGTKPDICRSLEDVLKVRVISTLVNDSIVVGSLCRGNSNGLLVPRGATVRDLDELDIPLHNLPSKLNAVGNVVLANDSAALVHPELSDSSVEKIAKVLKVDVRKGTIGGIRTVGMAGVATNKGLLVHPRASSQELASLEELFELPVEVGTSNFGTQMVGSGVVANSKGYIAGSQTTGHELGRIEDALGF